LAIATVDILNDSALWSGSYFERPSRNWPPKTTKEESNLCGII
jgi:hypothetical protein